MNRKINNLVSKLEDAQRAAIEILKSDTEVDTHFTVAVEQLEQELDEQIGDMKYFTLSTEEDILEFDSETERFLFKGDQLTCGSSLEVYYDESWNIGRVESSCKFKTETNPSGYYFYNKRDDNIALEPGMKVRKRISN